MISMRTTIDLPEDLHRIATAIARDTGSTLSEAVALLMRRAIEPSDAYLSISPRTGLKVLHLGGGPITSEDVRALDDDE
jgi:Arc/MetJ family transcription regulator